MRARLFLPPAEAGALLPLAAALRLPTPSTS